MTEIPKKMYSTGIYARLSVDGSERKRESIETQIEIAKEFIRRQEDMIFYGSYTDIGKTGTTFAREGFEQMMRDVRGRKIDCIVVKDLSRFGRNYIEMGNYIEKIFPFMGVRFIAVTDHFDTGNPAGGNDGLEVRLKNLINEMYAADIAMKVKAGKKAGWEKGSYIGGVAPYGYRAERIGDKKCLLVEEETAEIVKKIFMLFLSGKNIKEIVAWLYENRVARPAQYHKTGRVYCGEKGSLEQWSRSSVKMILTNSTYMGNLVHGQEVKEHIHEAIVDRDTFLGAAGKFKRRFSLCKKDGSSKTPPPEEDLRRLIQLDKKMEGIIRWESEQYIRLRTGEIAEEQFRKMKKRGDKKLSDIEKQRFTFREVYF